MANTIWNSSDKTGSITLSGGSLTATQGSGRAGARAVDGQASGKYYFEAAINAAGGNADVGFGVATVGAVLNTWGTGGNGTANTYVFEQGSGLIYSGTTAVIAAGGLANGDLVCVAVDLTGRAIWFRKGGTGNWNNSSSNNPATGVGGVALPSSVTLYPVVLFDSGVSSNLVANFGDSSFTGSPPSGYTSGWPATSSTTTHLRRMVGIIT